MRRKRDRERMMFAADIMAMVIKLIYMDSGCMKVYRNANLDNYRACLGTCGLKGIVNLSQQALS